MADELKPCPFCGGWARVYKFERRLCDSWHVICYECGAGTDEMRTKEGALAAWNRRAERTCQIIEDGYTDNPAVCSYCGTHYDGGRYCTYCGAKVVEE